MLSRRRFLAGSVGTLVALPFFRSLWPARAHAAAVARPVRLFVFYVPNGIVMPMWTPAREGALDVLPPTLQPLLPVKDRVLVLTGLKNLPAIPEGSGGHASGTGAFLTVTHLSDSETVIRNNISMDQLAAGALRGQTRFASLELGLDGGNALGFCDGNYACAYARNISWSGPTTPMPKINDPRKAFDRLFAGVDPTATAEERARRQRYGQSVLDRVRGDAESLRDRLGAGDRAKLEEYLTSVRELEQRMSGPTGACSVEPFVPSPSLPGQVKAMLDLTVLAYRCDLTRIVTFMLANAGSGRWHSFIGISESHHGLSHHMGDATMKAKLQKIETWEVGQLAYFLQQLRRVPNDDGTTLLDDAMVFFSSELEDANLHRHVNLPVLLCGGGGGALKSGRHVKYPEQPSIASLYLSMLAVMGVDKAKFGDATTRLGNLS